MHIVHTSCVCVQDLLSVGWADKKNTGGHNLHGDLLVAWLREHLYITVVHHYPVAIVSSNWLLWV